MTEPSGDAPDGPDATLVRLLGPLLRSMEMLGLVQRHFHPPSLADMLQQIGEPEQELRAALDNLHANPPNPEGQGLDVVIVMLRDAASLIADAWTGLRTAAQDPDGARTAFRALRNLPRAMELIYPLAGVLPPVCRYFLDRERRADDAFAHGFMGQTPPNTGVMRIGEDPDSRGSVFMYAPENMGPDVAKPLVVALHGGSGNGRAFLWSWLRDVRSRGGILVSPSSIGPTWSLTGEDADAARLNDIVELVRTNWSVDPARILLTGMSDGGTYSYLAGLAEGSPFTHLAPVAAAFHPMLVQGADAGRLRGVPVHIIHGALDWMFPLEMAQMARDFLSAAGARVTLREVDDLSHAWPGDMCGDILDWMDRSAGGRLH